MSRATGRGQEDVTCNYKETGFGFGWNLEKHELGSGWETQGRRRVFVKETNRSARGRARIEEPLEDWQGRRGRRKREGARTWCVRAGGPCDTPMQTVENMRTTIRAQKKADRRSDSV
jgi:hypothetical protein